MQKRGSVVKLSRRLGIPLTRKAAKVMESRPHPPGQHGPGQMFRRNKMSDYKVQLLEKQRLRAQYNIHERQLRNYYRMASRQVGNTAEALVQLLEQRLDAVVFRGGLAPTIYAARQYVSHKHILVNGKSVNIPSYQLKEGDVISVRQKSRKMDMFQSAIDGANPPAYLELSPENFSVTFKYLPIREEVPVVCEVSRVVEYYSR